MITEKRWILATGTERILKTLKRFEGIEEITKTEEVQTIWNNNKTPIFCKHKTEIKEYDEFVLEVPEFGEDDFNRFFTIWAHCNGFECGEFQTGELIDTREEPCILCSIANHKGMSRETMVYNKVVEKEVDCIIYESTRFFVATELGALKPGFVMIIPKEHQYLSIAQLPSFYRKEYEEVCKDVETILKGAFGKNLPVTFFEHGSGPSGLTSHKKSIVHAHTHVVIDFKIEKKYLDMIQMKPLNDISKARHTHYFAYKVGSEGRLLCCYDDNVYVQRQFPRQIMAMQLGYTPKLYNWRKYDFLENVHTTLYYIYKFLAKCEVNNRIKERTEAFVHGYAKREDFEV